MNGLIYRKQSFWIFSYYHSLGCVKLENFILNVSELLSFMKKNDQCTLARGLMPTISQIKTLLPCCATYLGDKGVSVLMTKLKY